MTEADPPQIDQVGEECMTSTPMRRTQPISQPSSYPINQALFSEAPPDTTQIEDRLKAMQMSEKKQIISNPGFGSIPFIRIIRMNFFTLFQIGDLVQCFEEECGLWRFAYLDAMIDTHKVIK